MRIDGIQLVQGSNISNLTVTSGTSFPSLPDNGELFYRTDSAENVRGLYCYIDSSWDRIASSDSLTAPSGASFPATSNAGDLFYKDSNDADEGLYLYNGSTWNPVGASATAYTITGDVTGTIDGGTDALTLATVATATTTGSASDTILVTINAKGLTTSVSSTPIAIAASQTTSGTFDDARISASNITQHEAALTLAASQIASGTFTDARVAQSNVTQHQAALSLAASQTASGTFANARISQSSVTQHQAALAITESQINDGTLLARLAANETVTGTWSFNNAITGVDPTTSSHLTTKNYVDNALLGLTWKHPVRAATVANITLSGTQTVDGIALIAGDRVLVKDQTTGSQNGVYVVAAGAWTRATDFDQTAPLDEVNSAAVFVSFGTANADTGWTQTAAITTVGTDAMVFVQFSAGGSFTAGAGLSQSGNAFNVGTASTSRIVVNADTIDLATVTNSGTGSFLKLATDTYGRVTGTTAVTASDVSGLISGTYVDTAGDTMTGNLVLNNATYLSSKIAAGTTTRIMGVNASDMLYLGGIDTAIAGVLFTSNAVETARLTTAGFGIYKAPSEILDVLNPNGRAHFYLETTSPSNTASIRLTSTAGSGQWAMTVGSGSTNNLAFSSTAGGEMMRLTTTGVGIGSTSTVARVTVLGGPTGTGGSEATVYVQSSAPSTIPATVSGSSVSSLQISGGGLDTGSSRGGQIDFNSGGWAASPGTLIFRAGTATGGTSQPERMRVDSSGATITGGLTIGSTVMTNLSQLVLSTEVSASKKALVTFPPTATAFSAIVTIQSNRATNDSSSANSFFARYNIVRGGGSTGANAYFAVTDGSEQFSTGSFASPIWYFDTTTGNAYVRFSQLATGNSFTFTVNVQMTGSVTPTIAVDSGTAPSGSVVTPWARNFADTASAKITFAGADKLVITSTAATFASTIALNADGQASFAPSLNSASAVSISNTNSGVGADARFNVTNGATTGGIIMRGTGFTTIAGEANAMITYVNGSNPLLFYTNGLERMRIDASGNVGIGVSPVNQFDLSKNVAGSTIAQVTNANAGTGADARIIASNGTDNVGMIMRGTGNTLASQGTIYVTGSNPLVFSTASVERMRIDSAGVMTQAGDMNIGGQVTLTRSSNSTIARNNTSGYLSLSGGNGLNDGPNIQLGGSTSATFPNLMVFRNNTTNLGAFTSIGQFLIGSTTSVTSTYAGSPAVPAIMAVDTSSASSVLLLMRNDATNAASTSLLSLGRSRSATAGSHTVVAVGDTLGAVNFVGSDGSAFKEAAKIIAQSDTGTPSATSMAGRLAFYTTPNASVTPALNMVLNAAGSLIVGGPVAATGSEKLLLSTTNAGNVSTAAVLQNLGTTVGTGVGLNFVTATNGGASIVLGGINMSAVGTVTAGTAAGDMSFNTVVAAVVSEKMRLSSAGILTIGSSAAAGLSGTTARAIEVAGGNTAGSTNVLTIETTTANQYSGITVVRNDSTIPRFGASINLARTRGTTDGSVTTVTSGDTLGGIAFSGADGTDIRTNAAEILAMAEGTVAANTMPGRLVFSTTAAGQATPTERVRIDSAGLVMIGTSTSRVITPTAPMKLQIETTDNNAGVSVTRNSADTAGPNYRFLKTRGTAVNTNTAVASGDSLGHLIWFGADGAGPIPAAEIRGEVDGTPGTNDMPGRLVFYTTADGASTTVERMRIDNAGNVLVTGSGGMGYGTGSGGAVTQATSRTTGVTLNKTNGAITLVSAAGTATWQSFTVTNSTVAATDVIRVCQKSGTDLYMIHVTAVAAGSFRISFATTGGATTEQPVFNFAVVKAATA